MGKYFVGIMMIVFSFGQSQAQTDSTKLNTHSKLKASGSESCERCSGSVKFYTNYFANSNAVTNSFINTFLFQDFIENEVKDHVSARLNETNNRFGIDLDFGIEVKIPGYEHLYTQHKNPTNSFFKKATKVFRVGQRDFTSLKFPGNFFELYFRGNKQFAGQSIDVAPVNYQYFSYQYLSYGLEIPNKFGITLNVLKGTRFTDVDLTRADLFTAADGDSLHFDSQLRVVQGDLEKSRLASFQGFGTSFDLKIDIPINEKMKLLARIDDLGFIAWSDMNSFEADSAWSFTGVEINNVLNINGDEFSNIESDSLSTLLGIKNEVRKQLFLLPTRFEVVLNHNINSQLNLDYGLRYYAKTANIPRLWTTAHYQLGSSIIPSCTIAYGGFSKFDVAIGAKFVLNNIDIGLNAFYLENLINSSKTTGQGINFYLTYFL